MVTPGRILCVVPARGGSKGIPRKNIRPCNGRPLIAYTLEVALACRSIDRLIVSTDDSEIAEVSRACGAEVPFLRPPALAMDDSPTVDVIRHAVRFVEQGGDVYEYIVILEPTSPLRIVHDVEEAVAKIREGGTDTVVGVKNLELDFSDVMVPMEGSYIAPFLDVQELTFRRQDSIRLVMLCGAVYVATRDILMDPRTMMFNPYGQNNHLRTKMVLVPDERSLEIDNLIEFELAELLLAKRETDGHGQQTE